jgi:hypothetical protein
VAECVSAAQGRGEGNGPSSIVPVSQPQPKPPSEDESEEFVAATLKVDPQGLSGKHRKDDEKKEEQPF